MKKKISKKRSLIRVLVAQWIAGWTSNTMLAGSSPAEDETKFFLVHKEGQNQKTSLWIHRNSLNKFLSHKDEKQIINIYSLH